MKSLGDVGQEMSKLELQCEWTCMNSGPSELGIDLFATFRTGSWDISQLKKS